MHRTPFTRVARVTRATHTAARRRACAALGLATVLSLALAGCASAPPTSGHFNAMTPGSTHAYWRVSTGSYGNAEGRVDWLLGKGDWQGRPMVINRSPTAGATVYDPQTHAMVAQLNGAGQAVTTWDPPIGPRWPVVVGDRWTSEHKVTVAASGRTLNVRVDWVVEAHERITVPAGSFDTWRTVSTDSFGEVQRVWSNPDLGLGVVRRELSRPASHPAGAGTLVGELIAYQRAP